MPLPTSPRAVITGAGSGFGRAIALEIARKKGRLLLCDVNEAGMAETVRQALAAGALEARAVRCDVSRLADLKAVARKCSGGIDLLVNNAGVSSAGAVGELPIADWRWTLGVDLWGVIHGCHVFVPIFRRQGHGHIVNVAAAAAVISAPMMGAYNVAKAGVVSLSETLAGELEGTGIGVTVVCPTFFQSRIVSDGRFSGDATRQVAERLMKSGQSAEVTARRALQAVQDKEFYCFPMRDAEWLWRAKRVAPDPFRRLIAQWAVFSQNRARRTPSGKNRSGDEKAL